MMTVWKNLNAGVIGKFTICSRILPPGVLNLGKMIPVKWRDFDATEIVYQM